MSAAATPAARAAARSRAAGRPPAPEPQALAARLIAAHGTELRDSARRYSLCADDADDACQRALEILLTKTPPAGEEDLVRWMRTVTKNEALAIRRQRVRLLSDPPEGGSREDQLDSIPAEDPELGERLERHEWLERSREALGVLKPHEVRCLALQAEGYSYSEIGQLTGWSYTKVNRLIAEGRRRFLDCFARIEDGRRCDDIEDALAALAGGDEQPERLPEVRRHLRACAPCRAKLRLQRGGRQWLPVFGTPLLAAVQSWLARLHDSVGAGLGERVAAAGSRLQPLGDLATAQKAAVAVAVTAAAAGGGTAAVEQIRHRAPRPAATRQAAVQPVPPAVAVAPAGLRAGPAAPAPEPAPGAGRSPRPRRDPSPAPARAELERRQAAVAEFGPEASGEPLGEGAGAASVSPTAGEWAEPAAGGSNAASGSSSPPSTDPEPPPPAARAPGGAEEFGP